MLAKELLAQRVIAALTAGTGYELQVVNGSYRVGKRQ